MQWENEVHVKPKNQHTRFTAVRCNDTLDASKVYIINI
jgi:ribosomal protein S27E